MADNNITCANGCGNHTQTGQACDPARIDARIAREIAAR